MKFQHISGSVLGQYHIVNFINNQDAYRFFKSEDLVVAVVSDGCSAGHNSEVGANLGSDRLLKLIVNTNWDDINNNENPKEKLTDTLRVYKNTLLKDIKLILNSITDRDERLERYFFFTLVAAVITKKHTYVFSLGDGYYGINGGVVSLEGVYRNAPPFLAHNLWGRETGFVINEIVPTDTVNNIFVATDGLEYLIKSEFRSIPGRKEQVGPVDQLWKSNKLFNSPVNLQKMLFDLNTTVYRPSSHEGRISKDVGLLFDDTTIISLRRPPEQPENQRTDGQ